MAADCHIHMILDGRDWKSAIARHQNGPDRVWIADVLDACRKKGLTYLRDGGDRWGVGRAAREMAGDFGVTYRTPLAPIFRRGHYGGFIGEGFGDLEEYRRLVDRTGKNGGDFIKVMISGLMDFDRFGVLSQPGLRPEEIQKMVEIAHAEGFSVMAHANGARTVQAAAEAGVDSVEHGAYLDEAALRAMQQAGTVWVPTLSTIGNLRGKGRFHEGAVEAILHSAQENLRRFHAMGGLIACGSDAGAWAVPHALGSEELLLQEVFGSETGKILTQGNAAIRAKF